jgi:phosphoglycerate dehydrogenase-like enzyme
VLDANPQLRVVANMAVGFNNFDIEACTARGVLATNTPDVLTETTADFGFALMMAAARRMAESEHFLRAGQWTRWAYDMFTGSDIHGATLGILGMGRIGQAHRAARRAGLRHAGDLPQPQPPAARAGGAAGRPPRRQGHAAARGRPPRARAAVLGRQPPRHRRGRSSPS